MKPRSLQIKFTRQASGYKIVIGHNLLDQAGPWARKCLGSEAAKAVIVSNPVVYRLYGRKVEKSLLAAGFTAGRNWPPGDLVQPPLPREGTRAVAEDDAWRRVMLMTVTDHFDRSDRVLAEIMNAPGPRALSAERQSAGDLLAASRLYRQYVIAMNEPGVAAVLEEVERVLLDIVHQPSSATEADLEEIRRRIDSAAVLFKVRVMSNELQQRLEESSPHRVTSPSTIG